MSSKVIAAARTDGAASEIRASTRAPRGAFTCTVLQRCHSDTARYRATSMVLRFASAVPLTSVGKPSHALP
jgi:hypothetical protein